MLRRYFLKRAIKKAAGDGMKVVRKEIKLVRRLSQNYANNLAAVRVSIDIKGRR